MFTSLRSQLLIMLVAVSLVALSAAFLIRTLIINDFGKYMDGESQDRIQCVIAGLEGHYIQRGGWDAGLMADGLIWAMMVGVESRVFDDAGRMVLDTKAAIASLPAAAARRVMEAGNYSLRNTDSEYVVYPLFYRGKESGRLEARLLYPVKEETFIRSSNRFLLYTTAALGLAVLVLSLLAARWMSKPIQELCEASAEIASGNLARRVKGSGPREMISLAGSFNHMADSLEAQEKLRRRLVSSAAHELRTPLAIISGELEGMIDGVLPMSREGLQSMHAEAVRLTAILNGLDDLTRAEAAALSLNCELLDLRSHLEAITARFERLFGEKGAIIQLECPAGLMLYADPDRLSQIMINLISNSCRAVTRGGCTVVRAAVCQDGVYISISDNGPGIAEAELPFVFERFFKGQGGGLGLGLAIVRELVAAHGGQVEAHSIAGQGAEFVVVLPAGKA